MMLRRTSFVLLLLQFALANTASAERVELQRHTVMADGHPVALWEKSAPGATESILLVHGRTWSALPDFDLQLDGENLSAMDSLVDAGYAVYAVDMRGYGETPRDATGWLTPDRAADDVAIVVAWIAGQGDWTASPHLFGWSMGSTVAQLMVQRHPGLVSSLTLYGYWRDVDSVLPADDPGMTPKKEANTAEAAASDFITAGSISQQAIDAYVAAALAADPVRVDIRGNDQYNALDGAMITVPTLVIAGEFDPLAPADKQAKLLLSLATGHKQFVSVPGGDHAALLERSRDHFFHEVVAFLQGVKMTGK
jgi:pimeloyl-ACP methyl ester carboxylesterase